MKMKIITLLFTATLMATSVPAAEFAIQWSTVDAGGGISTSNDRRWMLAGTAGQPDAGTAAAGGFELESGFWSGVRCASRLAIAKIHDASSASGAGSVRVSWPVDDMSGCACLLEAATELHANPALDLWLPEPFLRSGAGNVHESAATGPARFFRLRAGLPKGP